MKENSHYVNSLVLLDDCIWHMNKSIHECLKKEWSEEELNTRLAIIEKLMDLYEQWETCSDVSRYIELEKI